MKSPTALTIETKFDQLNWWKIGSERNVGVDNVRNILLKRKRSRNNKRVKAKLFWVAFALLQSLPIRVCDSCRYSSFGRHFHWATRGNSLPLQRKLSTLQLHHFNPLLSFHTKWILCFSFYSNNCWGKIILKVPIVHLSIFQ